MRKKIIVLVLGIIVLIYIFSGKINNFTQDKDKLKDVFLANECNENDNKIDDVQDAIDSDYDNVWILSVDKNCIYGYIYNGKKICFKMPKGNTLEITSNEVVADICVEDGIVKNIRLKRCIVNDETAKVVQDEVAKAVESKIYGRIDITDNFIEYMVEDNERAGKVYLVFDGEKACTLIKFMAQEKNNVNEETKTDSKDKTDEVIKTENTINVLLTETNYASAVFTSDSVMNVVDNTTDKKLAHNKKVTITCNDDKIRIKDGKGNKTYVKYGDKLIISSKSGINIKSGNKGGDVTYNGKIIILTENKKLTLVNKVGLEKYICGVVASEMPQSFDKQALAAQAVCARTYAVNCINSDNDKLKKYGADLDDTTSYQVYNKNNPKKSVKDAVKATNGKVLTYNHELSKVFYFSTSWGYTSKCEDVFGSNIPYMESAIQTIKDYRQIEVMSYGNAENELSGVVKSMDMKFSEKQFKDFYMSRESFLESQSPWFSWNVSIKKKNIAGRLADMYGKNISDIKDIIIAKRGTGGIVKEINIKTNNGNITISGQNNIRTVLSPADSVIIKNDGSKVKNFNLLPSAFFYITSAGDKFIIKGGGFGHGTGLSQYGANAMALSGADYKDILSHYFPGTVLCSLSFEE